MNKKLALVSLLSFLALVSAFQTVKAATIPSASLDKTTYLAGQTGYISVSVYNDESEKIRVTQLSATIDYYYTDGTVYMQTFFFPTEMLPDEIPAGQTETYQISISLPTNIAPGYTNPVVEARTELWQPQMDRWTSSDRPTYELKLYIESPYKQMYADSQEDLQNSQQALEEQKATSQSLSNTMNMLAVTTVVFAAAAAFLMFLVFTRRARPVPQP